MRPKAVAVATDAEAAADAEALLAAKGGAVDAVLAAYFSFAGKNRAALLAPAVALVGGAGAGARAFDGRALQPGAGLQRPRGVLPGEPPPAAARAAISRSPHMAVLLHAAHGRRPLREATRAGALAAKAGGAKRRADLLTQIGAGAMQPLRREDLYQAILRIAGTNAGGQVSEEDLANAAPTDEPARLAAGGDVRVVVAPWPSTPAGLVSFAACAADAWGLVAALALFGTQEVDDLVVPELEVQLPAVAEPVYRGKTRAQPRSILPVPARVALIDHGAPLRAAIALTGETPPDAEAFANTLAGSIRVDAALAEIGAGLAAVSEGATARAWRAA